MMKFDGKPFLILDGALATELERYGADLRDDLWSAKILAEDPEAILSIHLAYLEAGAEIITTSSYQATEAGFLKKGYTKKQAKEILHRSTRLAIEAREQFLSSHPSNESPNIAVSLGAYGAARSDGSEYTGNYGVSIEEIRNFHSRRLDLLAPEGGDMLLFETIPCLDEIKAILQIIPYFSGFEIAVSLSCEMAPLLRSKESLETALKLLDASGDVSIISFNCTHPANITGLLEFSQRWTNKTLMVYPNSGERWDVQHKCWLDNPDGKSLADYAEEWYQQGARIIGGCCRTRPEDVLLLKKIRSELT